MSPSHQLILHHTSSFTSLIPHLIKQKTLLLLCSDPTPSISSSQSLTLSLSLLSLTSIPTSNVVLLPSIPHLRAYLTTLPTPSAAASTTTTTATAAEASDIDQIVIWGLIESHHDAEGGLEWSAQGLGRTLARVMEAASRCEKDVRVVLVEWEGHREGTENVEGEGYDVGREPVRWDMMELEVLRGGGGGLVQVRKVVERWGVVGDAWESEERGGGND